MTEPLRVAIAGTGLMARVHAYAWRTAPLVFPSSRVAEVRVLLGRDSERSAAVASELRIPDYESELEKMLAREDIEVLDVCTPGHTHATLVAAALQAGKHVLCEKPLGTSVQDSAVMTHAAQLAGLRGVVAMAAYNLRFLPAIQEARRLISDGYIGTAVSIRALYLQDWLVSPQTAMSWRLDAVRAGSGALGDIGSHVVDLTQYLLGEQIVETVGLSKTQWPKRPDESGGDRLHDVTTDDLSAWLARFEGGCTALFEASRLSPTRNNSIRIEIDGTRGAITFDFDRLNELQLATSHDAAPPTGLRRVSVTGPGYPYGDVWWPAGLGLAYDHTFVHLVAELQSAIEERRVASPTFAEALQVQRVLASVQESDLKRRWMHVRS